MNRSQFRPSTKWALGGLAALGIATVVIAAPVTGTGPFALPTTGSPPKDIWMGPATTRCGARVKTTAGEVRVKATVAGSATSIGHVSAGVDCVFEGRFDKLSLECVTGPAEGQFDVRSPSDAPGGDRLVGSGSISFSPSGGGVGVYSSDAPLRRLVSIRPVGGACSIRTTRDGPDLVAVDAGDWSFAIRGNATGYFLNALASASVPFEIQNVQAACGPFTGTSIGKSGDTDAVSLDGQCSVTVVLSNPGPGTVTLKTQVSGYAEASQDVPPGGSASGSGALSKFEWLTTDTNPNRTTTVTLTATIQ